MPAENFPPITRRPTSSTPGTNGVGVIEAVGGEVCQLKVGQRVVFSPYLVVAENVDEPEQILIGLTSMGPGSARCKPTGRTVRSRNSPWRQSPRSRR
jgi:NADPH:quinone reductase-like Zn-dependent oxidoreductase